MNIKKLNEKINNMVKGKNSPEFVIEDLKYKLEFESGKIYTDSIATVENLGYKLNDINLAVINDIVLGNLELKGYNYVGEDSTYVSYENGVIKSISPIVVYNNGKKICISFEMTIWSHPELNIRNQR